MHLSKKTKVLSCLIIWRLISVFVVQTAHVPDEYWQSLEVAHRLAFGYGYLTWEWVMKIRSYTYPVLLSIMYHILTLISLDYVIILTVLPRIFQAIISAYGEYKFYKWTKNKWTLYSLCINWYWYYCATRTFYYYGMLVISPWEFFRVNVLYKIGDLYGTQHLLCLIHQRGSLDLMNLLRKEINTDNSNILFLTPCHATPLYSYLHMNVSTKILTCEPNFTNNTNYMDEADIFFANPMQWLDETYNKSNKNITIPNYVISFDHIVPKIGRFLKQYQLSSQIFYAHFPQSNYGKYIYVYKRK
ncbi:GPI mannosyltransferase 3 [Melipona quadrifasciata]|uniref:Mannosyltransferase n=1 Tax=Melipona quadrifasciata TaxID=166423 RepID=A0A0M8ZP32_9HYME|nr:GPI mannosyltransferase 3 [Melipona quadrifasciata]